MPVKRREFDQSTNGSTRAAGGRTGGWTAVQAEQHRNLHGLNAARGWFAPVKAEQATKVGIEHALDRYGVTKRERQIVEKICLGKTNKQIAEELFISLQTVKDHTHRIYSKIGINSRMQLVQLMNAAK